MSWGTKIAILYISFAVLIIAMVILSVNQKVDLVSADYYERELKYQDKIDGINNFSELGDKIVTEAKNQQVKIMFPKSMKDSLISGKINFYRPSDASLDMSFNLNYNTEREQLITSPKFKKGLYKMEIDLVVEGKKYYNEQNVFMN